MHKLRLIYYNNKKTIWAIILFIVFAFILLRLVNNLYKKDNEKKINEFNNNVISDNKEVITENSANTYIESDKSAVTGEDVSTENSKAEKIINEFVDFCNNQDIDGAYNLLSDDCKEEIYPTVDEFREKYLKNNFPQGNNKIVKIENWVKDIYKINISEDVLKSGNLNVTPIQDYITIVAQDGEKKLNISGFVSYKKLEKITTEDGVTVTVIDKKIYMDYEEYTLKIKNDTQNTILLDNFESTKTIYLEDQNNRKYYSYTQDIIKQLLKVNSGLTTQINIKFYKTYNSNSTSSKIVFSNFILNYKDYMNGNAITKSFAISL